MPALKKEETTMEVDPSTQNAVVFDWLKRTVGDKIANMFKKTSKLDSTSLPPGKHFEMGDASAPVGSIALRMSA